MKLIYFSYGMTKSASSFVYQLTEQLFAGSTLELKIIPPAIRRNNAPENYLEPLTDEIIDEILAWLPENSVTVIKTHGAPCVRAFELIESKKAFASCTVRDIRDIAVSMMDHGQRSRNSGIPDFANVIRPLDAVEDLKAQVVRSQEWSAIKNCVTLTYEAIKDDPISCVNWIIKQTGLAVSAEAALEPFRDTKRIIHYNVGVNNRFMSVFNDFEKDVFQREFGEFIRTYHDEAERQLTHANSAD